MTEPNPYAPPKEGWRTASMEHGSDGRMWLLRQVARSSFYAPLILVFASPVSTWSPLLWGLFLVIDGVALVLGGVAILGGIHRGAADVVRMGALGVLLSGYPLAVITYCVLR